ncbi:uncharacterized protein LOC119882564 isoform X4 [Micropterus salmoides]|uniref:uncharacterized protein LOC119882564 isoform X4 n=1 Tax=Micropterus salmoides TaxID=27706 RepID=UPI0018ED9FB8|nr:uncharacterized protein LOC119882564 isoform X4 [Micropterus salmoides]
MTSWWYETNWLLLVFLSTIDLSKEGCLDYVEVDKAWQKNQPNVTLLATMNSKDIIECSVQKMCFNNVIKTCDILTCLNRPDFNGTIKNENCVETNDTIDIHHFNCLLAKAIDSNYTLKGCEYETVCKLYLETPSTDKMCSEVVKIVEQLKQEKGNLQILLIMSMICNVVLPVVVYLYMRQHRMRDWSLQNVLNGGLQVAQPMSELECLSNGTYSPDIPMKNCSLEDGTL